MAGGGQKQALAGAAEVRETHHERRREDQSEIHQLGRSLPRVL